MKGIRSYIPSPVYTVTKDQLATEQFTDILTEGGCVYLSGCSVEGTSLYHMYCDFKAATFKDDETKTFFRTLLSIIDSSMQYREVTGSYPMLLLNTVYISDSLLSITFLSHRLIDYLNTFYDDDMRQVLYYPAVIHQKTKDSEEKSEKIVHTVNRTWEHQFTSILARLIYLFLTKNKREHAFEKGQSIYNSSIYYISTEMSGVPHGIADTVWHIMYGKKIQLAELRNAIETGLKSTTDPDRLDYVPFCRRRGIISFKAGMASFFNRRWKLLLIVLILIGIGIYLISDAMLTSRREDYTAGLEPKQVVELYYNAIDTLDLYYLDAVYYKRSGKKVKDELSTVYVMLKMESAFGKTLVQPEDIEGMEFDPQVHTVFGIRDLDVEKIQSGTEPIFRARYKRVVSSGEKLHETVMEETIQLQFIDDHWYITKSERSVLSEGLY